MDAVPAGLLASGAHVISGGHRRMVASARLNTCARMPQDLSFSARSISAFAAPSASASISSSERIGRSSHERIGLASI